eukprot:gene28237-37150_t
MNWTAEDSHGRWIYRTIYPSEVRMASQRLIQFENMEELNAEADWNFDQRTEDPNIPFTLSQRMTLVDIFPKGLSFFSFENDHPPAKIVQDLPVVAEMDDTFAVIVEGNAIVGNSNAFNQIVNKRSQPKKIHNAANEEITLKAFICYKANSDNLLGSQFIMVSDNNPIYHRTVAPAENEFISCVDCLIGGRLGAEPIPIGAQPSLFNLFEFKMHCFRMRAAAQPRPLCSEFDSDVHRLACVLYRGFDGDCCEEDTKNIIAILQFLDKNGYSIEALKMIKKQILIDLLTVLFMSECIDEEETKEVGLVLSWIRNELDLRSIKSIVAGPTRLQIALRYDVECSDEALDAINVSFEHHVISEAVSVVPRYEVVVSSSSSYEVLVDFSCESVPMHLLDFPVANFNGHQVIPKDKMIVIEAIVNHDGQQRPNAAQAHLQHGDLYLASPTGEEIYVKGAGILSNKRYWGYKWRCTAMARTTHKRCCNKTHDSSGRCHLHRDFAAYPERTLEELGSKVVG